MSIRERLQDPNERFSPAELYQVFEVMAEQYGFHRDPNLPPKGAIAETTSMVVKGFESWGVVIVKPRTNRDSMLTIPSLIDRILDGNMTPSQNTTFNAQLIALARTVIVSPVDIVDRILESQNDDDLKFFMAFATEYAEWMNERAKEAKAKKSGETPGNTSAS